MNSNKALSKQTLKRLPVYMSYLKTLDCDKVSYVSSAAVAKALDLNCVQVRKDLAAVCKSSGVPKKGFWLSDLTDGISDYLGYGNMTPAILVGTGNLGTALMSYGGFENYGISIIAAFDVRQEAIDNIRVFDMEHMKSICSTHDIKMGIITVPASSAQRVCDKLVENGIKGIWNFAPVHLKVPDSILVQNENMASSLALLSNHLKRKMSEDKN